MLNAAWACDQAVIVKFETQWCGPCRMLTQFLQSLMPRFPDLKIVRIDCEASDANREYAAAHGVQSYPTLMMYVNGVLVETIRGFNQQAVVDGIERIVKLVADQRGDSIPELSDRLADKMEARKGEAGTSLAEFLEASRLLVTFLRNVAMYPAEEKYRKVNRKNPRYVKHAAMLTEALLLCGFEEDGDNLVLGDEQVRKELVQTAKLLQRAMLQDARMPRRTEAARAGQAVVSAGDLSNALNSLV
jgi:thioredoxin 1